MIKNELPDLRDENELEEYVRQKEKTESALIFNIYKMDTYTYKKRLYAADALL